MDWKKFLFGNFDYEKMNQDNHAKTSLEIRGGLIPSILFWSGIIVLILYLIFRQGGDYGLQILLYKLRKEKNISQKEMADVIGKSENSYRNKELGKQDFKLSEMFKIAHYFGKELGDIFTPQTSRKVK